MNYRPRYINGKRVASPEYHSWQMMKNRCLNSRANDYRFYGGRGIAVCRRWLEFDNFIKDMGPRPTAKHTLERKNTNRNYCRSNCCWATRKQQARNRGYCRLTRKKAQNIRRKYDDGALQVDLAGEYGISQTLVSQVVRGVVWA